MTDKKCCVEIEIEIVPCHRSHNSCCPWCPSFCGLSEYGWWWYHYYQWDPQFMVPEMALRTIVKNELLWYVDSVCASNIYGIHVLCINIICIGWMEVIVATTKKALVAEGIYIIIREKEGIIYDWNSLRTKPDRLSKGHSTVSSHNNNNNIILFLFWDFRSFGILTLIVDFDA
jgi:hypothetical protein